MFAKRPIYRVFSVLLVVEFMSTLISPAYAAAASFSGPTKAVSSLHQVTVGSGSIFASAPVAPRLTTSSASMVDNILGDARKTIARESDGTVWAWGLSGNGKLGNNDPTDKNMPIQIFNSATSSGGAITWGGNGDDMGASTAVDGSGNVYVSGYFNGTVDFNPGGGVDSHTSNGGRDVFLSKFDSNRNFLWAKTWGGSGDERGESVAVDGSGNVYVAGPYRTTVDFDPGVGVDSHTAPGVENDAFLSKFNTNGNFQWARTWGGATGDEAYCVAVDGSDNAYVVGDFSSPTVDFNPGAGVDNHTMHGFFDAFLTKFDSNGNFIWAKTWGGEGYDDGPGVAVDSLGNVYVAGMYGSTDPNLNFDPAGGAGGLGHQAHDSGSIVDVFLSKFDSSGNFQWVRTWGAQGNDDVGQNVIVDGANNVYVGGRFGCSDYAINCTPRPCDFNPGTGTDNHTSNGLLDAFVSKFDSSGTFQWVKTWGGTGVDAESGLATDSSNNVYVTGVFTNSVDFGSGSGVSSNGLLDASLSKFDSAGNFQGAQTWGGPGDDGGNKLAMDAVGNVYVAGWFHNTVDFDPGSGVDSYTSNGGNDAFLSILSEAFPPINNTVDVFIGGSQKWSYVVSSGGRVTPTYPGIQNGPVEVVSTNGLPIFTSERALFGPYSTFNEVMGYPDNQLTTKYWFPWYDGKYMTTWVLVGNPSATLTAHVTITIGSGVSAISYNYTIGPKDKVTPTYPGVLDGPVKVESDIPVFTSERALYGPASSFNEVMGYPDDQLTTKYWFPWYDNKDMTTWVLVGNPSDSVDAHVTITIGSRAGVTYTIPPNGRITPTYPGVQDGPVKVESDISVFTSERALFGPYSTFNEVMGYPDNQLTTKYWFPWYDNKDMTTWVLVGNPSATLTANVTITIGSGAGVNYTIPPNGRVTPTYPGVQDGPVKVESNIPVFTSERALYGPASSFNEVMGYPDNQLTTKYWFPWYDGKDMTTWVLVGAP